MRSPKLDKSKVNWNKLVLLHGPPGSGKTSLCRALAQKLTIRMSQHFTRGKLVELSTHALLSKWFGESGKLVSKVFNDIVSIALEEDESNLVCVLIDEIETLTGIRGRGTEVSDALRATNQLLTALDKLRDRPNVIVLCTSNLPHIIDPAFLDRVDVKQRIPNPSSAAAYEILRSTMNELLRGGVVVVPVASDDMSPSERGEGGTTKSSVVEGESMTPSVADTELTSSGPYRFPSLAETRIKLYDLPDSAPQRLWTIAKGCEVRVVKDVVHLSSH